MNHLIQTYKNAGYTCVTTSINDQSSIEHLKTLIANKTTVFTGHSGVGKSSLLNALSSNLNLRVGEVSDAHHKGKHTTTHAELFEIDKNTFIIDTPGVKSFGIVDFKREEVARYFPDLFKISSNCKFTNCLHINEPNCAVKEAIDNNTLAGFRYQNYINIYDSDNYKEEWD